MKSIIGKVLVLAFLVMLCTPVFAQNKTKFSITPRVWLANMDLPTEEQISTESFFLPMYGGTLTISPSSAPNLSILLTGLTGSGDGEASTLYYGGLPAKLKADRTDIELLLRYNLPNKNFAIYAGGRYVNFDQRVEVPDEEYGFDTKFNMWIPEVGLGTTVNISENGRHRFFSNITFGLALQTWDYRNTEGERESSDVSPQATIDFNAGYQYAFSEHFSFSARYRLFTIVSDANPIGGIDQKKLVTVHGPEVGLNITF